MTDKAEQLIEAAIDLFAKEGFWNTPTSRIAKRAGVATGTLFNYFASKDVLIDKVYKQLKQEWLAHIMVGYPENGRLQARIEHIWFRSIDWGVNFPTRYQLMMQLKLSNLVSVETQQIHEADLAFAYAMIEQGIEEEIFIAIESTYLAQIFEAQLETAVRYALQHQLSDMPLIKHITSGFQIFWQGVTQLANQPVQKGTKAM